jgi:hypothetical protein
MRIEGVLPLEAAGNHHSDRRTTEVTQLSEARRHIVLRYLWIDRRDLCADDDERDYYDTLTASLDESRLRLARATTRRTRSRRRGRRVQGSPLPPAAA